MKINTLRALADDVLGRQPLERSLLLDFGEAVVDLKTNSAALLEELGSYFEGFIAAEDRRPSCEVLAVDMPAPDWKLDLEVRPPEPGKFKIKEEFLDFPDGRLVRKRLTDVHFLFGPGLNLALGPCLDNANQVVNFINNRLIQDELDHGALLAHAAAVSLGDRGLALAGFAGMGKSTLALHLMSRGLTFVSNDRLLIRENGLMRGVPKLPRINPGTALNNPDLASVIPNDEREIFEKMATDEIWDLEHKYDVKISECFGPGRFDLTGRLHALTILNWNRNETGPRIRPVDLAARPDLLQAVRKDPGLFFQPQGHAPDYSEGAYLERLQEVAVFEITGGVDFQAAASACLDNLAGL